MSETIAVKAEPAKLFLWGKEMCGKQCAPVKSFDDDLKALIGRMVFTMRAYDGIGLAAPQIGIFKQVAVVHDISDVTRGQVLYLVNPKMVDQGGKQLGPDGCLSIPGPKTQQRTYRSEWIKFEYQDLDGERVEMECSDMQARVVQHELSHLRGEFYIDLLTPMRRDMVLGAHRKWLRSNKF